MTNILVINAGSSSIKYQLINMEGEQLLAKGICERIGLNGSKLEHKAHGKKLEKVATMQNHSQAIKYILDALTDSEYGVISSLSDIKAVGHRVVHGGEDFTASVKIDQQALDAIRRNADLAPLHNPPNIIGIEACQDVMNVPQCAVFDTTFHSTMPAYAYMYGIKYEDYQEYKIRRYGFHGTSHLYVSTEAQKLVGNNSKIITCHLGNGSSIAAVNNGKCVDTSMGLTPLEGLIMGTRSGDIDAAVLGYLMGKKGWDINKATNYLNKESGVSGISGVSSDFRDLHKAKEEGNARAQLALDMFCYRVKKYIGAYAAAMGGLDAIVFTGGIGENDAPVRHAVCTGLEFLGVDFDAQKNQTAPRGTQQELNSANSKVKVYIIPTNEELVIARETLALIK